MRAMYRSASIDDEDEIDDASSSTEQSASVSMAKIIAVRSNPEDDIYRTTAITSRPRLKILVLSLLLAVGAVFLLRTTSLHILIRGWTGSRNNDPYDPRYWDDAWPFVEPPYASGKVGEIISRGKLGNMFTLQYTEQDRHCRETDEVHPVESICSYSIPLGDSKFREANVEDEEGMLIIYRKSISWFAPAFVRTFLDDFPEEIMLVLGRDGENQERYRLILMAINPDEVYDGFTTSSLQKFGKSIVIASETGGTVAFYGGVVGTDPFKLIAEGVGMVVKHAVGTDIQQTTSEPITRVPDFAKKLGWSSWNTFHTYITGHKVIDAVKSLQDAGVQLGWSIIDDGWQRTTDDSFNSSTPEDRKLIRLGSLGASDIKFPAADPQLLSFEETISILKRSNDDGGNGLSHVLAWHALSGYWLGLETSAGAAMVKGVPVALKLPAASLFYPHFSSGIIKNRPSTANQWSAMLGMGEANDPSDYFERYYTFMTNAGLDGVKVDVQGITGTLHPLEARKYDKSYVHRHQVSFRMHDSLSTSINNHFGMDNFDTGVAQAPIIHSMNHAPEILYRIPNLYGPNLPLLRANEHFFPDGPSSHGRMVLEAAFNSLILGPLSIPDFGVFQSFVPDSEVVSGYDVAKLHAVARSISGGPVYISDKPDATNATLLQELVCKDGTILPCSRAGLPIRSNLLRAPGSFGPLVVQNTNGVPGGQITSGVLGIFNVRPTSTPDPTSASTAISIHPSDINGFGPFPPRTPFLVFSHGSRRAQVLRSADEAFDIDDIPLNRLWSDIVTIVPIAKLAQVYGSLAHYQCAPLGLLGKFNAGGAILRREHNDKTAAARTRLLVRGCGEFSVLVRKMTAKGIFQKMPDAVKIVRVGDMAVPHKELSLREHGDAAPILGVEGKGFNLVEFDVPCTKNEQWVTVDLVV